VLAPHLLPLVIQPSETLEMVPAWQSVPVAPLSSCSPVSLHVRSCYHTDVCSVQCGGGRLQTAKSRQAVPVFMSTLRELCRFVEFWDGHDKNKDRIQLQAMAITTPDRGQLLFRGLLTGHCRSHCVMPEASIECHDSVSATFSVSVALTRPEGCCNVINVCAIEMQFRFVSASRFTYLLATFLALSTAWVWTSAARGRCETLVWLATEIKYTLCMGARVVNVERKSNSCRPSGVSKQVRVTRITSNGVSVPIGLWVQKFPPENFRKFIPIFRKIFTKNTVHTFQITVYLFTSSLSIGFYSTSVH